MIWQCHFLQEHYCPKVFGIKDNWERVVEIGTSLEDPAEVLEGNLARLSQQRRLPLYL